MIASEVLAAMSTEEIAHAIAEHHKETTLLYEAMATKSTKRTNGAKPMGDDKVLNAEYWLKIAKEQRKILAMDFDLAGFDESVIIFKCMTELVNLNGNLSVKLKTAREIAATDCFFFSSIVRKAIQGKEKDPVYALILEKEPKPRKTPVSNDAQAKSDSAKPKEETATPETV